jgi:hypothetical protein
VLWFLLPQQINENLIPLVIALFVNALPGELISMKSQNQALTAS